jgi:acyl-coenzyme A thioesterase PaaI-like protein
MALGGFWLGRGCGVNSLRLISRLRFLSPRRRLEWYPPFWLMGVKVLDLAEDWSQARLRLPLTAFSRNMGDAMFGGYQAALADPIAALACVKRFPGHAVWTRAMHIDFMREGNSDLELRFQFDAGLMAQIAAELAATGRSTPRFEYGFYRADGRQCTHVINTVAIRPAGYSGR